MPNSKFIDWLTKEMENRGWSQSELAKRTDQEISQAYVSLVILGKKPATWNFCAAIANAFGYSPIEVFRLAGLLPGNGSVLAKEITDLSQRLPQDKQEDLLQYAKYLMTSKKAA